MLIWGSKGRQKETGQGSFYCPKCGDVRPYKQKKVSKYFTLYFIPLFETSNIGEYVECQVCSSGFDPKILEPSSQAILQGVAAVRYALLHGTSPAAIKKQLRQAGLDAETATKIIELAQA